jgi:predicted DNA-binding protein (MmcQ/YjbR family)
MLLEEIRDYCLAKKGVIEDLPFGESTLVFKIGGKIFALVSMDSIPLSFNLKCDPEKAVELREMYTSVQPGYHMNKKHWNTILADGSVSRQVLHQWIDHSYDLVVASLSKAQKQVLQDS